MHAISLKQAFQIMPSFSAKAFSTSSSHQLVIVGGGPGGLASLKAAKELGIKTLLLEQSQKVGGVWESTGKNWGHLPTNLSKFTCQFSDFPHLPSTPMFPTQKMMWNYLQDYTAYFKLSPDIQLGAKVIHVTQKKEGWQVTWEKSNRVETSCFKNIILAPGIFGDGPIPYIPGLETFKGSVIHSKEFSEKRRWTNKAVCVVGHSSSAVEIAADLADHGAKVFNVFRKPEYVLPRWIGRYPDDFVFFRRPSGRNKEDSLEESHRMLNRFCNQGSIHPALVVDEKSPANVCISQTYLEKVHSGSITPIRSAIASVNRSNLILENGSILTPDFLIFGTGYVPNLSFLDAKILSTLEYQKENRSMPWILYHCTFHPDLEGLGMLGMPRPYFGVMELQARWMASVFFRRLSLPSKTEMRKGLDEARALRAQNPQSPYSYVDLSRKIASKLGVWPTKQDLKNESIKVRNQVLNGTFFPPHLRLKGYGRDSDLARQMIEQMAILEASLR